MSNISTELTNHYGYTIMAVEGEGLDIGGCALTAPGLTDVDLNKTYEKLVTLQEEGRYIGFAGISSAIGYICRAEKTKDIKNITYWGSPEALYYLKLRFALCKEDADDLLCTERDNEVWKNKKEKKDYLSRVMGRKVGKAVNKHEVICKPCNLLKYADK
jgi:hypothetical protein